MFGALKALKMWSAIRDKLLTPQHLVLRGKHRLTRQPLHKLFPPQHPVLRGKYPILEETRSVLLDLVDENGVDAVEPLIKGRRILLIDELGCRGYGCIFIADRGIVPVIRLCSVFDLNNRRVRDTVRDWTHTH
jgi:hypothetical protein